MMKNSARHTDKASKNIFIDLMILLVSAMVGLNSVMSFSNESEENRTPFVNLPLVSRSKSVGISKVDNPSITIQSAEKGKVYFYNGNEVTLPELIKRIKNAKISTVVLRGDREMVFKWQEHCRLSSRLMEAGVKAISYAIISKGGNKP